MPAPGCAPPPPPAPRPLLARPVPRGRVVFRAVVLGAHIAVAALSVAPAAGAQSNPAGTGGALTASWDKPSAPVGDSVTLTLSFTLGPGGRLHDPPAVGGLEELTVLGREAGPGQIRIRLLVDRLDTLTTGALTLTWLDKDQKPQKLYADSLSLAVSSNLGDKPEEAQLRPLQGIVPVRPPWLRHLPWVLGVLGLALAAAGLYGWHRMRRRFAGTAASAEPAHLRAQREIERLETQKLFEKGRVKEHYFRLSQILRKYLEALRGFPAAEYTVEEIARHLKTDADRRLLVLLRQADLVKFADDSPTVARKEEELKTALAYIRETAPPPQPPPAGATAAEGAG